MLTKNKRGDIEKSYATAKGDFEDCKIYVLIDENSAQRDVLSNGHTAKAIKIITMNILIGWIAANF